MKALIRGDEIIVEPFSKWIEDHLDWLTTARPNGDGYELVEDYEPRKSPKKPLKIDLTYNI